MQTSVNTPLAVARGIVLAPMEGVIDAGMRALLCRQASYERCVTEFVRVTDLVLPAHVFHKFCPELAAGGHTDNGTPVYVQLLGSNPEALAGNARRAVALGAPGIDLNFGCPAKTVNRRQGGSVLLREPPGLTPIIAAVRDATPAEIPVTVKIRLGYDNADELAEIVAAVRAAGADELAIHARTKFDGYKPPAHWHCVAPVADAATRINGDIFTVADARHALRDSGCAALMLGRGALAAPDLGARIARDDDAPPQAWIEVVDLVEQRFVDGDCHSPRHTGNRTKQWLAYLKRHYAEAQDLFALIRPLHDAMAIRAAFAEHRGRLVEARAEPCGEKSQRLLPAVPPTVATVSTIQP